KETSIPSWLIGKYYIDLSNEQRYKDNLPDLTTTLFNSREGAPPLGPITRPTNKPEVKFEKTDVLDNEPIKIKGILADEVSEPKNDGTIGSALYKIPFELNRVPNSTWRKIFINAWDHPESYDNMHRPGIASVLGNKIILYGTTIEEVEK